MSQSPPPSAALPLAHVVLRVLIVMNWMLAALIVVLLLVAPTDRWILSSLGLQPSPEGDRAILLLKSIAVLGLIAVPLHYMIFKRLLAMVETVRAGDPFVAANAVRLRTIAWLLLVIQVLSMIIGGLAKAVSTPEHPFNVDAGFSVNGWLAVLLTFLLARVFDAGTVMRDDLEGTV
ncbi:MAG TPA: DUF2975 domain-containing protein [Vicinamibacterales bacterium]